MDSNGNECSETCTSNSSEGTIRPCGISVEEPSVEVVKDENELHKIESVNFYQIPGTTLYVDIKDGIVTAGPLSGNEEDKSKRIHKVLHIETSLDQTIHLKVALFSESCSKYIVVRNGNRVELGDSAMWYAAHRNGDSIMFQTTGKVTFVGQGYRVFQIEWSGIGPILRKKMSRLNHVIRLILPTVIWHSTSPFKIMFC